MSILTFNLKAHHDFYAEKIRKNAVPRGYVLMEGTTLIERNGQIGEHRR